MGATPRRSMSERASLPKGRREGVARASRADGLMDCAKEDRASCGALENLNES